MKKLIEENIMELAIVCLIGLLFTLMFGGVILADYHKAKTQHLAIEAGLIQRVEEGQVVWTKP